MSVAEEIIKLLNQALEGLGLGGVQVGLEHPSDESHGEWSSNIALAGFSVLSSRPLEVEGTNITRAKNPRELAQTIADYINNHRPEWLVKTEVAGPGFINFFVSEQYLFAQLDLVLGQSVDYGKKTPDTRKKVVVEYTDPNPFKEFHIGHLYSNIVGESLARLFEFAGKEVHRVCYQGDVGMHVAKTLWGIEQKFKVQSEKLKVTGQSSKLEEVGQRPLKERIEFLGQAYALGATAYKDDEQAKNEMVLTNFLVYKSAQDRLVEEEGWQPQVDYSRLVEIDQDKLQRVGEWYRMGRAWSLEYFEEIYRRLGTNNNKPEGKVFEQYFFESVVGEYGYKYVMEGLEKGVFEKGEGGAVIFPGEKYGLHTRVFVNAKGLPTYEAKDLGLAPTKYKFLAYDESVIVTGNEIAEYFKVVLKAMEMLEPELRAKTKHISHGMVRLPEGKMSSRTGKILKGEWLLDEAKKRVEEVLLAREKGGQEKVVEGTGDDVAEMVGLGAVKFALLSGNVGRDVVFDFDESVSIEGKSGPYVQYTFARCLSVLRKASNFQFPIFNFQTNSNESNPNSQTGGVHVLSQIEEALKGTDWVGAGIELNSEERAVLVWLNRFEETVERAGVEYAPHIVAGYVYELAQRFNTFYNKHSILGTTQNETLNSKSEILNKFQIPNSNMQSERVVFRVVMTAAVARVLKTGLGLLGIGAPAQM